MTKILQSLSIKFSLCGKKTVVVVPVITTRGSRPGCVCKAPLHYI